LTQFVDLIFHCAHSDSILDNVLINSNVIWWWKNNQPNAQLITFGTDACYSPVFPHEEENYLFGEPLREWYSLGIQKRLLYIMLTEQVSLKWQHFGITTLFGSGFKENGNTLVHDLVEKVVSSKLYGNEIQIKGDGTQFKEIIYVDDLITNVSNIILHTQFSNDVLNLGSPSKQVKVSDIVEHLCSIANVNPSKIQYSDFKNNGTKEKYLNSKKAMDILEQNSIEYEDTDILKSLGVTFDFHLNRTEKK